MIRFSKSGLNDLSIPNGRSLPSTTEYDINQIAHFTDNGVIKVVKFGEAEKIIELTFDGLTRDNFDGAHNGLKNWFSSSQIDFMLNSFTMTDENGEQYTVRLADPKFNIRQVENGIFSIRLKLRVEG